MRVREVWLHAVDLDAGFTCHDIPAGLAATLLAEVAQWLGRSPKCPAVDLLPDDWVSLRVGPSGPAAVTVSGTTADLLAWVTGRAAGSELGARGPTDEDAVLPVLPA